MNLFEIITFYRIVDSTPEGINKVHTQYNEVLGKYYTSKQYRNLVLSDLSEYMEKSRS